jgi:hypothetical protein
MLVGPGPGAGAAGGPAATQVFDPGSYTVPKPQSVALLNPGDTNITNASGASALAHMTARRQTMLLIAGLPRILPDLGLCEIL